MNVNLEIRFVKNKLIYDYIDFFKTRINISSAKPGQHTYLVLGVALSSLRTGNKLTVYGFRHW